MKVDIQQAKSQLAQLADLVENGETVVITRDGKPCVDMVLHRRIGGRREPGRLKGHIVIASDFDATPVTVLRDFERS